MLEEFSAGYWLAPSLEVVLYGGNRAVVQDDVFNEIMGEPGHHSTVAFAGGSHFELYPDPTIPCDYVAVPAGLGLGMKDGDSVLFPKELPAGFE